MNPKVKMRAEMEEKFRRKYEEKAKELEAEFQRKFEEVKKDFARQVSEIYLDYQSEERLQTYTNALVSYGEENQCIVAIEELSECAKELCKVLRGKGDRDHLAEEIADAQICMEQMIYFFGLQEDVDRWMDSKIKRLDKNLKN